MFRSDFSKFIIFLWNVHIALGILHGNTSDVLRIKKNVDTTFYGHPKTQEERWHENFQSDRLEIAAKEAESLVQLLNKIVGQYLTECTPIVLYDHYIEIHDGVILETFFKVFFNKILFCKAAFNILN